MNRLKKIIKAILTMLLSLISLCLLIFTYFLYFVCLERTTGNLIKHETLKNKNVARVTILESESDLPDYTFKIEILTKNEDRILLWYKTYPWPFPTEHITIPQINDIESHGGQTFEIRKGDEIFYEPDDMKVLGKMLGIRLKNMGDIANHVDELYELYELFESNSRKDFLYKEKFRVYGDFSKTSKQEVEKSNKTEVIK